MLEGERTVSQLLHILGRAFLTLSEISGSMFAEFTFSQYPSPSAIDCPLYRPEVG